MNRIRLDKASDVVSNTKADIGCITESGQQAVVVVEGVNIRLGSQARARGGSKSSLQCADEPTFAPDFWQRGVPRPFLLALAPTMQVYSHYEGRLCSQWGLDLERPQLWEPENPSMGRGS